MTVLEAIELFKHEMTNEIFHLDVNEVTRDSLLESISSVESTVISTYEAYEKSK